MPFSVKLKYVTKCIINPRSLSLYYHCINSDICRIWWAIELNTAANGLVFIIGDFGLVFGHFPLFNKKGGFMGGAVFGLIDHPQKKL